MPSLTKENARQHCRTCLVKLSGGETEENTGHNTDELKDLLINITTNQELQHLITKYINEQGCEQLPEFPQNMCLDCYNKLHAFEKFRRRAQESASKLYAVLCDENTSKVEIEFEDDTNELTKETNRNDDLYKLMFKDTLMETESVMLGNAEISTLASVEIHVPDPFEIAATPSMPEEIDGPNLLCKDGDQSSTDSTGSVHQGWHDNDSSEEESGDSSEKIDRKRTLRSGTKGLTEAVINIKKAAKKKRRTKKEMEEFRKKKIEDADSKIKRRHRGTKNCFKCTQCNHSFAHKITLDAHIRKIHEGSKRPFQCDRCDKAYTFIGGLYTHIKEIHETQVRSYTCDYPDCERVYTSFIAMQKHKRFKHMPTATQKKYVCEQCGTTFNQSGNLKYHRRTKHPTEADLAEKEKSKERFECTICKKLFHSRYTLKYHTLQLHSDDMKYECNVCGRKMAKKFMLLQHMLVHSTEKIPCEHCGKQFIRKFELEAHIRAVHMKLKPFECQYCSECFASRKTLRHHEYIHTGEKPYVCDICGQAYRQQTCLKNHRKSHEKLNPEALLAANLNRNLMNTFLGPPQAACDGSGIVSMEQPDISSSTQNPSPSIQ